MLIGYDYIHKGTKTDLGVVHTIYTFRASIVNQQYIVEAAHLDHNIFVLQFYLKSHRLSENRFQILLNAKNARHTMYVMNTIVNITAEIIAKNQVASFGFMGAPTRKEADRKKNPARINSDNTVQKTKRFKSYSLYVKRYFDPNTFTHIEYADSSCYLLRNNGNPDLTEDVAEGYLNELIAKKNCD